MQLDTNKKVSKQNEQDSPKLLPATDVYESKDGVVLYLDLPGVDKDNLQIDIDKDVLNITGKINLNISNDMQPSYVDVKANTYERRFTLGDELDTNAIDANLEQGLLTLKIPRLERHKPKKIDIKVA